MSVFVSGFKIPKRFIRALENFEGKRQVILHCSIFSLKEKENLQTRTLFLLDSSLRDQPEVGGMSF